MGPPQMMVWAKPERAHIARLGARWMVVAVHVLRAHLQPAPLGRPAAQALHALTRDELDWLLEWQSAPQVQGVAAGSDLHRDTSVCM